jgi:hypothetical protein
MQQAQHFAGLFGIEDDAVLRKLDGAAPVEALGVAQQVEAVDRHLRIFRQADDVVAQATTAGQFAGEWRKRELCLLGDGRRPGVLNGEHLGFPPKKMGRETPKIGRPKTCSKFQGRPKMDAALRQAGSVLGSGVGGCGEHLPMP